MHDGRSETELRCLREALSTLGERYAVGFVVAGIDGALVFATARARRLLGARGSLMLPAELGPLLEDGGDGSERALKEDRAIRASLPGSHHPVNVRAVRLVGTPRHLLLTLEEEASRGLLAQRLAQLHGLSARSIQLVQLASRGLKNREIGARMRLSEASVKTYMHAVFRDLGVRNRAELVALAERLAREA